jgi:hypothetical protein
MPIQTPNEPNIGFVLTERSQYKTTLSYRRNSLSHNGPKAKFLSIIIGFVLQNYIYGPYPSAVATSDGRGPPWSLYVKEQRQSPRRRPPGPYVKAKPLGAARRNAVGGPSGRAERARAEPKAALAAGAESDETRACRAQFANAAISCPGRNAKPNLMSKNQNLGDSITTTTPRPAELSSTDCLPYPCPQSVIMGPLLHSVL